MSEFSPSDRPINPESKVEPTDEELLEFLNNSRFFNSNFKKEIANEFNSEKHGEWIRRQLKRMYTTKQSGLIHGLMVSFKKDWEERKERAV